MPSEARPAFGELRRVYVRSSPIHGRGVFARTPLPLGLLVGRYAGPRAVRNGPFVLWLPRGEDWIGIRGTNALRYVNHASEPNAEFRAAELYTLRPVEADEEITVHYGEDSGLE